MMRQRRRMRRDVLHVAGNDSTAVGLERFNTVLIALNLCFDLNNWKEGFGNKLFSLEMGE